MEPEILRREKFLVMGTLTRLEPATESPEKFGAIWSDFEAHHEEIQRHSTDRRYYGVSFSAGQDGCVDYLAGMATAPVETIPEGLVVREVPAARYAVFKCPVQAIAQTYGYIFGEWRGTSAHEIDSSAPTFEEYPPVGDTQSPVLIHIPIRE
jgi:predicted transcriptional regulator YdeE